MIPLAAEHPSRSRKLVASVSLLLLLGALVAFVHSPTSVSAGSNGSRVMSFVSLASSSHPRLAVLSTGAQGLGIGEFIPSGSDGAVVSSLASSPSSAPTPCEIAWPNDHIRYVCSLCNDCRACVEEQNYFMECGECMKCKPCADGFKSCSVSPTAAPTPDPNPVGPEWSAPPMVAAFLKKRAS